jgi:hypothetical protein
MLQKADAASRLTFAARPRPARTPDASMSPDSADTIELTDTLDFTVGWLTSDSARPTASLLIYAGHTAYGPQQLRQTWTASPSSRRTARARSYSGPVSNGAARVGPLQAATKSRHYYQGEARSTRPSHATAMTS